MRHKLAVAISLASRFMLEIYTSLRIAYLNATRMDARATLAVGRDVRISPRARIVLGTAPITIGDRSRIGDFAVLSSHGAPIAVGERSYINQSCVLFGGTSIGDDCMLAPHVVVSPGTHNYKERGRNIVSQGLTQNGVAIGNDVWVGSNVSILDGARVADGCVIGAGSVVRGQLEPFGVYVGAPARKISERE